MFVDFEKAFDSVSWSFIHKVLKLFGFGDSSISWIKVLNKNAKLAVNQGGNLSQLFYIGRGCRQGDPVSTSIFVLCAEILALMIRSNKNIKGIFINNKEYKLSQYADDTSVILDGSENSLRETVNVLHDFSIISFDKTQVVWIGKGKFSSATIKSRWKLSWDKTDFKLLGIKFHVDLEKITDINFKEKIQKIKSLIKIWK